MSRPPEAPSQGPRFAKQFVLTFGVVFPTQQVLAHGLMPLFGTWTGPLPTVVRDVVTVALMCLVLMKALPAAYRAGGAWLVR